MANIGRSSSTGGKAPPPPSRSLPGPATTEQVKLEVKKRMELMREEKKKQQMEERRRNQASADDLQGMTGVINEEDETKEDESKERVVVNINMNEEAGKLFVSGPRDEIEAAKQIVGLATAYAGNLNGQAAKTHTLMTGERKLRESRKSKAATATHYQGMAFVAGALGWITDEIDVCPKSITSARLYDDGGEGLKLRIRVNKILKAGAQAFLWLRRLASFTSRPSEMKSDNDWRSFPQGPFWAHRALRGAFAMEDEPPKKGAGRQTKKVIQEVRRNMVVPMPSGILGGVRLNLGDDAPDYRQILSCFCWGSNSAVLMECVEQGSKGRWELTGFPLQNRELPTLIVSSHGLIERVGVSEAAGTISIKRTGGMVEKIKDGAKTNLCNHVVGNDVEDEEEL